MRTERQERERMQNTIRLNNRGVDAWEAGHCNAAIQLFQQCLANSGFDGFNSFPPPGPAGIAGDSSRTVVPQTSSELHNANYTSFVVFCCPRRFNEALVFSLSENPASTVLSPCVLMNFAMVLHSMGEHLCKEQWIMNAKNVYEQAMMLLNGLVGPDATFMIICAVNNMAALHRHYFEFQESSQYLHSLSVAIQKNISLLSVSLSQKECRDLILNVVLGSSSPPTTCAA